MFAGSRFGTGESSGHFSALMVTTMADRLQPHVSSDEYERRHVVSACAASYRLLPKGSRRRYIILVCAQAFIALLDLAGVLLIGLVGLLGSALISGDELPTWLDEGMPGVADSLDTNQILFVSAAFAGSLLILKSVLAGVLSLSMLRLLSRAQVDVATHAYRSVLLSTRDATFVGSSQEASIALGQSSYYAFTQLLGFLALCTSEVAVFVLLGGALLLLEPASAVIAVGIFSVVAVLLHFVLLRWSGTAGQNQIIASVAAMRAVQESLLLKREISIAGRRIEFIARFRTSLSRSAQAWVRLLFSAQAPKLAFEIALVVAAATIAVLQLATQSPDRAVSGLVLFLAAGSRLMPSALRAQTALVAMRASAGLAEPFYRFVASAQRGSDSQTEAFKIVMPNSVTQALDRMPAIEVKDVAYRYHSADTPTFLGVSFGIPFGHSVVVIGRSGAGKSTLADLITGQILPTSGRVLIDGVDANEAVERWPGLLGYVPQEVNVLNGTIRENILLGLSGEDFSDAHLWALLAMVQLDSVLHCERSGLDTLVGEGGVSLSGGQRQRLGLVRALVTSPRILVLDEPTSALDAETEQTIIATLRALRGQCTVITVSHRRSSLGVVDMSLVVEAGKVFVGQPSPRPETHPPLLCGSTLQWDGTRDGS